MEENFKAQERLTRELGFINDTYELKKDINK